MKKKLPRVFQVPVDKEAGNNNKVFYSKEEMKIPNTKQTYEKNINQKIKDIFKSPSYIYQADVIITLRDNIINKKIIGKNQTHIITNENELIPITDIIDIKLSKI